MIQYIEKICGKSRFGKNVASFSLTLQLPMALHQMIQIYVFQKHPSVLPFNFHQLMQTQSQIKIFGSFFPQRLGYFH
jgi:hypothetical protein